MFFFFSKNMLLNIESHKNPILVLDLQNKIIQYETFKMSYLVTKYLASCKERLM